MSGWTPNKNPEAEELNLGPSTMGHLFVLSKPNHLGRSALLWLRPIELGVRYSPPPPKQPFPNPFRLFFSGGGALTRKGLNSRKYLSECQGSTIYLEDRKASHSRALELAKKAAFLLGWDGQSERQGEV